MHEHFDPGLPTGRPPGHRRGHWPKIFFVHVPFSFLTHASQNRAWMQQVYETVSVTLIGRGISALVLAYRTGLNGLGEVLTPADSAPKVGTQHHAVGNCYLKHSWEFSMQKKS